jgi:hypothetical protein
MGLTCGLTMCKNPKPNTTCILSYVPPASNNGEKSSFYIRFELRQKLWVEGLALG